MGEERREGGGEETEEAGFIFLEMGALKAGW